MYKITAFVSRHSQIIGAGLTLFALGSTKLFQSDYEMLLRWSLMNRSGIEERKPSVYLSRLFNEVCDHFLLTDTERSKLDLFLTGVDQSCAVGSVSSDGYAFVGLPEFASYSSISDISVDSPAYETPFFIHSSYSEIGQERFNLMVIPEPALRFLIARELVRLGAKPKNGGCRTMSARDLSTIGATSLILSMYAAYQMSYFVNRKLLLRAHWRSSSRLLLYTGVTLLALFVDWQTCSAVHRLHCARVDRCVAHMGPAFVHGGIDYYDWRLRWNRFWYDRIAEWDVWRKRPTPHDPLKELQERKAEKGARAVLDDKTGYYVPLAPETDNSKIPPAREMNPGAYSSHFTYNLNPRITASGNERWSGDGDGFNFGLTGLLNCGFLPATLALFFSVFSYPANSQYRLAVLQHMAAEQHSTAVPT